VATTPFPDAVLVQARYYNHNYAVFPMSTSIYASTSVKIQAAWAPLVQQILTTVNADAVNQAQSTAPAMNSTIDSLINQLSSLSTDNTNKLAALAKAGLLEGQVLSSKAITNTNNSSSAQTSVNQQTQFIVNIKVNNQLLELISAKSLAAGTQLQLVVKPDNTVTIVNITEPGNKATASPSQDKTNNSTLPLRQPLTKLSKALNNDSLNTIKSSPPVNTAEAKPTTNLRPNTHSIIEQNLRQTLPLQQPVEKLLPLLQQLSKQSPPQWPRSLTKNLDVLLKQFPSAKQLQQPAGVKQAIYNSGTFFEAKLASLRVNTNNPNPTIQNSSKTINYDIKGLLQRIVGQINKSAEANKTTSTRTTSTNQSTHNQAQTPIYTPQALSELLSNLQKPTTTKVENSDKNADILLRQLSNQLIASLARSQTNQLETLLHRRASAPDQQAPSNSWSVETPIVQGNHIDNLSIRIDQRAKEDGSDRDKSEQSKQWTVMLAFDLHQLGKMNVQLKIIDQTVSATVWTEQQHTHQQAQQEVQQLKKNLQKVGVNVKKIDCQLGLPTNNTQPLYNKLVDVRT
jgi:hypothetical protein